MNQAQMIAAGAAVLSAFGMWLLLPRGAQPGRRLGAVLAIAGLIGFGWQLPRLVPWTSDAVFLILAAVTVISAAGAVTLRSPVYCAIWFAMTLLGTAGLFLFQGAQFLGVATITVYAGAILVTFLFVLMLAQPEGHAYYDRISWEGFLSSIAGAGMVLVLTTAVTAALGPPADETTNPAAVLADRSTSEARAAEILSPDHMQHLGANLFSRHLVAVEVAGTLLLAALVGAIAIVAQHRGQSAPSGGPRHG